MARSQAPNPFADPLFDAAAAASAARRSPLDWDARLLAASLRSVPVTLLHGASAQDRHALLAQAVLPLLGRRGEDRGPPGAKRSARVLPFPDLRGSPDRRRGTPGLPRGSAVESVLVIDDWQGKPLKRLAERLPAAGAAGGSVLLVLEGFEQALAEAATAAEPDPFWQELAQAVQPEAGNVHLLLSTADAQRPALRWLARQLPAFGEHALELRPMQSSATPQLAAVPAWGDAAPGAAQQRPQPAGSPVAGARTGTPAGSAAGTAAPQQSAREITEAEWLQAVDAALERAAVSARQEADPVAQPVPALQIKPAVDPRPATEPASAPEATVKTREAGAVATPDNGAVPGTVVAAGLGDGATASNVAAPAAAGERSGVVAPGCVVAPGGVVAPEGVVEPEGVVATAAAVEAAAAADAPAPGSVPFGATPHAADAPAHAATPSADSAPKLPGQAPAQRPIARQAVLAFAALFGIALLAVLWSRRDVDAPERVESRAPLASRAPLVSRAPPAAAPAGPAASAALAAAPATAPAPVQPPPPVIIALGSTPAPEQPIAAAQRPVVVIAPPAAEGARTTPTTAAAAATATMTPTPTTPTPTMPSLPTQSPAPKVAPAAPSAVTPPVAPPVKPPVTPPATLPATATPNPAATAPTTAATSAAPAPAEPGTALRSALTGLPLLDLRQGRREVAAQLGVPSAAPARLALVRYDALAALPGSPGLPGKDPVRIVAPLFIEPVQVWVPAASPLRHWHQLRGKRVDVGRDGGDALSAAGIRQAMFGSAAQPPMSARSDAAALAALQRGEIDAVLRIRAGDFAAAAGAAVAGGQLRLLTLDRGDPSTSRALRQYLASPGITSTAGRTASGETLGVMSFLVVRAADEAQREALAATALRALCAALPDLRRNGGAPWAGVRPTERLPAGRDYAAATEQAASGCSAGASPTTSASPTTFPTTFPATLPAALAATSARPNALPNAVPNAGAGDRTPGMPGTPTPAAPAARRIVNPVAKASQP